MDISGDLLPRALPSEMATAAPLVEIATPLKSLVSTLASTLTRTSAAYAALGFAAGMFAWHIAGSWGFVAGVVVHQPAKTQEQIVTAAAPLEQRAFNQPGTPAGTSDITTGSIAPAPPPSPRARHCITSAPGAAGAKVQAADCQPRDALREGGLLQRGDRLPSTPSPVDDAATWQLGTGFEKNNAEAANTPTPASASTLTPSDVNLDLGGYPSNKLAPE